MHVEVSPSVYPFGLELSTGPDPLCIAACRAGRNTKKRTTTRSSRHHVHFHTHAAHTPLTVLRRVRAAPPPHRAAAAFSRGPGPRALFSCVVLRHPDSTRVCVWSPRSFTCVWLDTAVCGHQATRQLRSLHSRGCVTAVPWRDELPLAASVVAPGFAADVPPVLGRLKG